METTRHAQDLFGQMTGKAVASLVLWADANHKILRELADLSAITAKEAVRLHGELQSSAVEGMKDGQASWLRRQGDVGEWQRDPFACYQRSLMDGVEATQKAVRRLEGNTQAITRWAEQLQATAEHTSREIQETFTTLAANVKALYAPPSNG